MFMIPPPPCSLDVWLCLAHLPRLFSGCVTSLLSEKSDVIKTASTVMEVEQRTNKQ